MLWISVTNLFDNPKQYSSKVGVFMLLIKGNVSETELYERERERERELRLSKREV